MNEFFALLLLSSFVDIALSVRLRSIQPELGKTVNSIKQLVFEIRNIVEV